MIGVVSGLEGVGYGARETDICKYVKKVYSFHFQDLKNITILEA